MNTRDEILGMVATEAAEAIAGSLQPVCSASRLQELKIKAHERELQKCDQMLTDAGVPGWVMNSDSNGVPSNSVASRLKWYLARRKNVERWETDQTLQREMEENLRHAQAYTQARPNDQAQARRSLTQQ